jgi:hypothetical protein
MVAAPTTAQPVSTGYFLIGREITIATVAPTWTSVKAKPLKPVNKPQWLRDAAMWGDMNELHDLQQGPTWAELEIPESPLYGDTFGHLAFGFFGDYVATGTAASPNSTLNGGVSAGATSITVTSGASFATNQWIQVDVSSIAEIVQVASVATNVITLNTNTPLRFAHLTGVAVTNTTGPYTHTFATLNPNSGTGLTNCQPPSHSVAHYNYLPGSGGHYSDLFLYAVVTDLSITGDASGWLAYSAKLTSYIQSAPGSTPTASLSTIKGVPAWRGTNTVASSAVNDIAKWSIDFNRKVDVIPTADGVQNPYFLGLGAMTAKFKLTVDPAIDESQLNYMLNSTIPTFAWSTSNGLSGTNVVTLAINAQLAGYMNAPLEATKEFWGYNVDGELVASATNAGNSGGNTLCNLVLTNNVASY